MGIARAMGQRARGLGELTRFRQALLGLCAVILPAIVYLWTMPPTVDGLDSAELSVGAYTLGLVHPPGYPLYRVAVWHHVGGYRCCQQPAESIFDILRPTTGDSVARV